MSIEKKADGVFKVRWWEGGRQKSVIVHGSHDLAKKVERKKMSARDENRKRRSCGPDTSARR